MKTNIKFLLMILCWVLCVDAHAQTSHWEFDAYAYRYDMTAYVSLSIDGAMVTDYTDYEIAAFCGEECRGIASIQKVEREEAKNTFGYLRIRSNQDVGETITFKVFQVSTNHEMNIYNTSLEFHSQQVVGMPSTPMTLPVVHFIVSVSCDESMGTVSGGGVYEAGDKATVTAMPVEGYHFVNWSDGEEANPYEFTVTEDVSLSALFAPNQYVMTFVLDNGEEDVVKTQYFGSELTAPSDPSKTGFTFKGWSPDVPAIVPASDQTFTAQWERNSYKLTWDVDGVKTENMVLYEAPITKPVDPEKTGYTFAGWTPEVATTMPAGDVTYTATWTAIEYSITYDLAGGTLAEGMTNPTSYTIESEDITLVNPAREGYTFAGWTGTDLAEATQTVTIAKGSYGDRSFNAIWTANQYAMTFVLDNGEENVVITQDYGTELTAPAAPTKTGFTFNGWSPEVPATIPASDQTFTAQWERNSYKLTWDVDGEKTESMVLFEAPITKPADPEKTGYTFAGWTPEVAATMPAEDVTYTATWTAIEYSLTYDLAEGTLAEGMTNPTSYTIESEDITLVNPIREGYTFEGWIGTDLTEPTNKVTIVKGSIGNRSYTATWTVSSAISTILSDSKMVNVYDLGGRLIRRNIPVSSLKNELPVGIYIVSGKKVKITK